MTSANDESVICLDDDPQSDYVLVVPPLMNTASCCNCSKVRKSRRNQSKPHQSRNLAKDIQPDLVIDLCDSLSEEQCTTNVPREWECGICLEPLASGQEIATTPCGHIFCRRCLIQAICETMKCPKCRRSIKDAAEAITLYP